MTTNTTDTDEPETDRDRTSETGDDPRRALSRRRFVQASAAAGALVLGGSSIAAGQSLVDETCASFGEITVGDNDDFLLINNDWGASVEDHNYEMCSWLADDGSYGYEWSTRPDLGEEEPEPNYPQVLLGTKPWGTDTGVESFPIQRGDVDELVLDIDADVDASGGEWNLAEEWWLMEQPVSQETETHTHEIMLVLDWSDAHSHGGVQEPAVRTDRFGNTIDYWQYYDGGGGTSAGFHIFRVSGGMTTGKVDLKEIIDFLSQRRGVRDDLWLSGIEVGNEYWPNVRGDVTYNKLDVTVNGTTYRSGSGGGPDPDPIQVGDYEARDSTDDGLHNDFDGDGQTTHDDVSAFFESIDSDGAQNNPDAFDFDGDGSLGFGDVVDLLRRV